MFRRQKASRQPSPMHQLPIVVWNAFSYTAHSHTCDALSVGARRSGTKKHDLLTPWLDGNPHALTVLEQRRPDRSEANGRWASESFDQTSYCMVRNIHMLT